jgi:hypothetical protein
VRDEILTELSQHETVKGLDAQSILQARPHSAGSLHDCGAEKLTICTVKGW